MRFTTVFIATFAALLQLTSAAPTESDSELHKRAQPEGVDVSSHQGNVDWAALKSSGVSFAY
ncbi:hypothetical protein FRC03_001139, partial [Tulasnella sp. 419]